MSGKKYIKQTIICPKGSTFDFSLQQKLATIDASHF